MARKDIKLFIASSGELNDERREFDSVLMQVNKNFRHLHLESTNWEYDTVSGSYPGKKRIQDNINPVLATSHIVVVLCYSKIGEFTREEYEYARKMDFKIFIYFKKGFAAETTSQSKAYTELLEFKDELIEEGAVQYDTYLSTKDYSQKLQLELNKYLRKIYPDNLQQIPVQILTKEVQHKEKFHWIHHYTLPKYFVGREKELLDLDNLIFDTNLEAGKIKIISIIGIGGLGKSCLTRILVERIKKEEKEIDCCIWYSFGSSRSSDGGDLLRAIAKQVLPDAYKIGQKEKKSSRYYFDKVKEFIITNKVLLILDNFESIQSLEDRKSNSFGKIRKDFDLILELFQVISDYEYSKVIITSRTRITNFYDNGFHEEINLNSLQPKDGVELLKLLGVQGSNKELLNLTNLLGNHALIIKATGYLIKKKRLKPLEVKDYLGPTVFNSTAEGEKLSEILNLYKEFLSEDQKYFLVMLSYHLRDVSIDAIDVLINNSDTTPKSTIEIFENIINPLINLGLIEERIIDEKSFFHLHPLMKFAFTNWWSENPAELAYEQLAEAAMAEGSQVDDLYITRVEQLQIYFDIVHYYVKAKKADMAFSYLEGRYHLLQRYRQSERIYEVLKEIENLGIDSNNFLNLLYIRISETTSNVKESIEYMKNAIRLDKEHGAFRVKYSDLGKFHTLNLVKKGYLEEAFEAIDEYKLTADQNIQGNKYFQLGNYEKALKSFLTHRDTIYIHDEHDMRRSAQRIGPLYMYLEKYKESGEILREALDGAKVNSDFCCILPLYKYNIDLAVCENKNELAINLFWEMEDYTEKWGIDNINVYSYYFLTNQLNWIKRNIEKDLKESIENNDFIDEIEYNLIYAKYYKIIKEKENADLHIDRAIQLSETHGIYKHNYRLQVVQSEKKNIV